MTNEEAISKLLEKRYIREKAREKTIDSLEFLIGVCKKKDFWVKQLSRADMAISDLLHDIELSNLSAPQRSQRVKMLKEWREYRRLCKNLSFLASNVSINGLKAALGIWNNSQYSPRVIKELTCGNEEKVIGA